MRQEIVFGVFGGLHLWLKGVGFALGQGQAQFLGHGGSVVLVEQGVFHLLGLGVVRGRKGPAEKVM